VILVNMGRNLVVHLENTFSSAINFMDSQIEIKIVLET